MKNLIPYLLILFLCGWIIFQSTCGKPKIQLIDNTELFNRLDSLKKVNSDLKRFNDTLSQNYASHMNLKDSVVLKLKTRYISVYDTISKTTVDCLPKIHVDSLILTYENLLNDADTLIKVQTLQITSLEETTGTQSNIIDNQQVNEETLKKALKKSKLQKWKFGVIGVVVGYVTGKVI